jgi:uncharacterized membrane-anchored protein
MSKKLFSVPAFVLLLLFASLPAFSDSAPAAPSEQDPQQAALVAAVEAAQKVIKRGPQDIPLLDQATLKLPAQFGFVPSAEAAQYLKALGNVPGSSLAGLIVPVDGQKGDWFVTVNFIPSGYIKDDDAKVWNADELLESIRAGTEEDNKRRAQVGIPALEIVGWAEKPMYDEKTKRLVWSIIARDKGQPATADSGINYNTYALGRDGYFSLNLVSGQNTITEDKPAAHTLLSALQYNDGKRYDNFNATTDKVAEYGLAALVAGVAAKKLGLLAAGAVFFAKFWKLLVVGVVGVGALAKKFFKGKAA